MEAHPAFMVRRSIPRRKLDERAFPIRVKVLRKAVGPDWLRQDRAELWLRENIGVGEFARYGVVDKQPDVEGFYFRTVEAAQRFLNAFPDCELADTTHMVQHLQEAKRWAGSGQSWQDFRTPGNKTMERGGCIHEFPPNADPE